MPSMSPAPRTWPWCWNTSCGVRGSLMLTPCLMRPLLCRFGAARPRSRRYEDAAAVQAAVPQLGERYIDLLEAVLARLELDFALRGQGHELHQLGEAAHEATDHADLARDDLDGGKVDAAAVADHEVGTANGQHRRSLCGRAELADEVEHDLDASPARELAHLLDGILTGLHDVVGTHVPGHLERFVRDVDGDDLGAARGPQALHADVPETADADDGAAGPWGQQRQRLLHGPKRGQSSVRVGGDVFGGETLFKLKGRALHRLQVLREAAVDVQTRELRVLAVHVLAPAAGRADAVGLQRVHDNGVARSQRGDR